ncbi:MAG: right-handed parallel beta-helix repeat-containing protein [Methanotrichaceae archaeon]|nr:right-handed parallel beta-helix repeat-containing protein [Methanotrichaceae archaeon]
MDCVNLINIANALPSRVVQVKILAYLAYVLPILILIISTVCAATIQVSSNLQRALDTASPGDTIQVASGAYDKIEVEKNLKIESEGAVIRANDRDACVRILADGVSFSGFIVRNGFYGITLENVKNCNINNNTVIHCAQPGIMLKFSNNNIIANNNASFNGVGGEGWYGIYLTNSNNNLIKNNRAYGNGAYGINLFPSCNNNTIRNNALEGNMYGLYMFTNCVGNTIDNNVISMNTNSGIDMRFDCQRNVIQNNIIKDNVVAGITLMDSGHNLMKSNAISDNGHYGMQIQGRSDDNIIANNTIAKSQTGLYIESSNNQIYGNNISDNVVQAEDRGENSWYAEYPTGGNLWSDYMGEDQMSGPSQNLPGMDHFGDKPYNISEKVEDRYPIMGNQVQQIQIIDKSLSPTRAKVGDNIALKARVQAKYGLSQLTIRAINSEGNEAKAYARMVLSGDAHQGVDAYQGVLSTALMDPGIFKIILVAKDIRGYEFKEVIGEVELTPR